MASSNSNKQKKPVGRPRSDGKPHLTREDVLVVCMGLFAEHGYAGTGIRMIADALQSSPASIFNLFGSKEGILNEVIEFASRPSLNFYHALNGTDEVPVVKLYKCIFEEVMAVSSADQEQAALFYLPELRKPEMSMAQQLRETMIQNYAQLIKDAAKAGDLKIESITQTAEQVFQLTETAIVGGPKLKKIRPKDQARQTSRFCLRAMLNDPQRLPDIEAAASKIKLQIELPSHVIKNS